MGSYGWTLILISSGDQCSLSLFKKRESESWGRLQHVGQRGMSCLSQCIPHTLSRCYPWPMCQKTRQINTSWKIKNIQNSDLLKHSIVKPNCCFYVNEHLKVKYTPHIKTNLIQAIISTVKFNLKRWTAFCHQQKSSLKQSHVFSEPKEKTVFTLFWIMRNAKINSLQVTNNSALLHLKGSDSPGGPTCSILWL